MMMAVFGGSASARSRFRGTSFSSREVQVLHLDPYSVRFLDERSLHEAVVALTS